MNIFINEKLIKISDQKTIVNESGSLGDTLAWVPIINQFAIQNNYLINLFTPFKNLFINNYPLIKFYDYAQKPNESNYSIGFFNQSDKLKNLQQICSDILKIDYQEARPKINYDVKNNNFSKKYVCIAIQSTSQCKYWNNQEGWQKVVDYLKSLNYEVICIDRYENYGISSHMNTMPKNCINKTGDLPLEDRINDLMHCDFFIGLSSGLSWLAWACGKPVVMISGFTDIWNEFYTKYRVINKNVCNSCWNDSSLKFDASNWLWCPRNKNFECSKEISFAMVKEKIDQCINELKINS